MESNPRRIIPLEPVETHIQVVNSHFIASLSPARTIDEARAFQKEIKARYPDATHHVPAFVIGHGNAVVAHCSDDGEPSGTAGRPALAVLQGSGLGNVAVVVTRYFGGTKLGTGGLVKAYGDAVREVLKLVKRGVQIPTLTVGVETPYPFYEQVRRLALQNQAEIQDTTFEVSVTLVLRFPEAAYQAFQEELNTLTSGQVEPVVLFRDPDTAFPL
ncbi:MAG TPA: YigZ family protein [Anaerolineaceae bacterium]|nr:YigZ family protein [Anaerolineaceae bacterium]